MSSRSIFNKAGGWVINHLIKLELAAVSLLFLSLLVFNYTQWSINYLIVIPLLMLAVIYYLCSFGLPQEANQPFYILIIQKTTFIIICVGFLGLGFEFLKNEGAQLMLKIATFSLLILLMIQLVLKIAKKEDIPDWIFLRTLILAFMFGGIYYIAF